MLTGIGLLDSVTKSFFEASETMSKHSTPGSRKQLRDFPNKANH